MASRKINRITPFNVTALALGLAFLYLPIVILVIYSFNDSRLVTVWGGWSLRWYHEFFNDRAMMDAAWMSLACRRGFGDDRDGSGHARSRGADPRRALQRPHAVLRHALCAACDARSDLRPLAACCCSSRSMPAAASGP